jgi:diguanylate cyclase (GGDEF)-like protein
MRDPLTGLANRRLLDELLAASLSRVERSCEPVQVVYVDLNDFKAVNDIHGHAAGDAVLQETARRFKAAVRVGDIVARVGGDEFVLVLQPAVDAFEAFRTRVDCALAEPIDVGGGIKVSCTASIGLADSRTTGTDPARLLSAADANMYGRKSAAPKR